ncbi:hypothetical protein [Kribbella sp. NPDC051770]|uniref:hypothetical protein n=1 Tax=Kribbella sp. NPDC051770 TaxID=3155413 RepID=UPI00344312C5
MAIDLGRPPSGYELLVTPEFAQDLRRLTDEDRRTGSRLQVVVVGLVKQLAEGRTDGHHCLGYEPGKGDLRDCVTAYVHSGRAPKADYRLVFREIGPAAPGGRPQRELLAVRPRRGSADAYAHVCARLARHPFDRQPGLDRFGDREPGVRRSRDEREAELDAKRAIAHAWAGQRPLSSSRLLGGVSAARGREPPAGAGRSANPRSSSSVRRSSISAATRPGTSAREQPRPGIAGSPSVRGATGWPVRGGERTA